MKVTELMSRHVITTTPEGSLIEAAALIYENDVRHLPVVVDGQLVGILSDRDIRTFFVPRGDPMAEDDGAFDTGTVSDVMSGDTITTTPEAPVDDVIALMLEHKVGAVPVVEPRSDRLIGIVSYTDVLKAAVGRL